MTPPLLILLTNFVKKFMAPRIFTILQLRAVQMNALNLQIVIFVVMVLSKLNLMKLVTVKI